MGNGAYGVMGIFDRCRDPRAIPGAGVAPPGLFPSWEELLLLSFCLLSFSWRRRRNCSLFMVVVPESLDATVADWTRDWTEDLKG